MVTQLPNTVKVQLYIQCPQAHPNNTQNSIPNRFKGEAIFSLLFSLLLLLPAPCASAPEARKTTSSPFLLRALDDFGHVVTSPLRMTRHDTWKTIGFFGLMAGLMFTLDKPVHEQYGIEDRNRPLAIPEALDSVGEIYDRVGTHAFAFGTTCAMLTTALLLDNSKLLQTTGLLAEALVFTKAITFVGKRGLGRARPFTQRGARNFHLLNLKNKNENQSTPSGHTSSMFAMMTVIAKQYNHWWVAVPAYTFAISVGFQRVDSRSHWLSDVVVGGTLGYLVGNALVKRRAKPGQNNITFRPMVAPNQVGAAFQARF